MTNPDNILKSRYSTLLTMVCVVKAMIFYSHHLVMWELDHKEGWAPKNWCFWNVVLEKDSWESLGLQGDQTQFSSVTQSCLTLFDPMNRSMPDPPVHHQLPESTQTHAHRVSDAIQPSHTLSSPSPPAPKPSQHQGLFQSTNSLHEVAKVLEFQL